MQHNKISVIGEIGATTKGFRLVFSLLFSTYPFVLSRCALLFVFLLFAVGTARRASQMTKLAFHFNLSTPTSTDR